MESARIKSYAKINLTLHVTGEEGGYHTLDSLVASVDAYDLIKLKKRRDGDVNIIMHGRDSELIPPEQNNAYKAAKSYMSRFGCTGADITVYKNIPMRAGLGGSSADAAGVLRGMECLYGLARGGALKELADELGSDTGYMLGGGYARLFGRGDRVAPIKSRLRLDFLMLLPPDGVSTAECYSRCALGHGNSDGAVAALLSGDKAALGKNMYNGLFAAAASLNAGVQRAYEELSEFDPLGVCMTGSGGGVCALFENGEFCEYAATRYRGKFRAFIFKTV